MLRFAHRSELELAGYRMRDGRGWFFREVDPDERVSVRNANLLLHLPHDCRPFVEPSRELSVLGLARYAMDQTTA
jgi:hypothetical protein